jgi:hypothetical protein
MEGRLDGRDRPLDLHFHAVARAADNRQAVVLNVLHDRVIVLLGGTEPLGELGRGQEVSVVGLFGFCKFARKASKPA